MPAKTNQALQFEALWSLINRANCTVQVVDVTTDGLLVFHSIQQTRHWDAAWWSNAAGQDRQRMVAWSEDCHQN